MKMTGCFEIFGKKSGFVTLSMPDDTDFPILLFDWEAIESP
jgi:hypothetical protein